MLDRFLTCWYNLVMILKGGAELETVYLYIFSCARWLIAGVSLLLVFVWTRYFLGNRVTPPILALLSSADDRIIPITCSENMIGKAKSSDVMLGFRDILNKHALLCFENGKWWLTPLAGKVFVNDRQINNPINVKFGDRITFGSHTFTFLHKENGDISSKRKTSAIPSLVFMSVFQILLCVCVSLRFISKLNPLVPLCFLLLIIGQWIYYIVGSHFEGFKMLVELPILYLSTLGLAACACTVPEQLLKQMICYVGGFVTFLILTLILRHHETIIKLQRGIMVLSVLLLYFTAFFGAEKGGSRNWIIIGGFSFQPSELVKVAFVICGGITLYLIHKSTVRRLEFLVFGALCMCGLAIMLDFGAVAIFFVGFLIMLNLRLEHPLIMAGIVGVAVLGGGLAIILYPYIARRFGVWLHAWDFVDSTGYQQTRTMMSFASGGLLGVGGGNGHLDEIPAAETDLVFGIIGEEWGAIVALVSALCILAIAVYAFRLMRTSDNLFNSITVGGSMAMIVFQTALNILGSVDILPLTGVTFIFVSRGGTSLISAWMMLSFFKAAELRRRPIFSLKGRNEL